MKKSKVLLLIIMVLSLMRFSCGDEPGTDLKIHIQCYAGDLTNAEFTGTYTVDGEINLMTPKAFGSSAYLFEKKVTAEELLEISATKVNESGELQIKIYDDDGDKIEDAYLEAYTKTGSNFQYSLRLEYEIPDEDDDSSD
jgi:hypothetical protein